MADAVLDFEWERPGKGALRWNPNSRRPFRFFGPKSVGPYLHRQPDHGGTTYRPLREHPTLFRLFGEVEPTTDGILSFAEQYGRLGIQRRLPQPQYSDSEDIGGEDEGEALEDWAYQVRTMRQLIQLSEAVASHDRRKVSALLESIQPTLTWIKPEPPNRDDLSLARTRLRLHLNSQLAAVTAHVDIRQDGTLVLAYRPHSLIGALWYQFAAGLGHGKRYPRCLFCQRPFEISRDPITGRRSHSSFCSPECKLKDFRARKTRAVELAAAGTPFAEIVSQVGRGRNPRKTAATVRGWLQAIRSRRSK